MNGNLIADWSMTDLATSRVVFDRNGRVADVAEPASLALFGLALAGLGALRRRGG